MTFQPGEGAAPPVQENLSVRRADILKAVADRDLAVARYRRYLVACNERDWAALGDLVADEVLANGSPRSRREYIEGIAAVARVFPDCRWDLQRAVVEGDWLAVHLTASATRPDSSQAGPAGETLQTDEFVMYRLAGGQISEMEGTADNARLI